MHRPASQPMGWDEVLSSSKKDNHDADDEDSTIKKKNASIGKSSSSRVMKKLTDSNSRERGDTASTKDRPGSPADQKRKDKKEGDSLTKSASTAARTSSEATGSPAKLRSDTMTSLPVKEIVEKDAIWLLDPITDVATVRACTLERAIDKLILESLAPDQQQFLSAFVLTYRFFTTAERFFELITKRFDLPSEPALDAESWKRKQQTARLRVCIVLRYWLANSFFDFDEKLLKAVTDFIEYRITPLLTNSAQSLLQIIEKRRKYSHDPPAIRSDPLPRPLISPEQWNLKLVTSMPPLEVARQLTLIEHESYVQIKSQEFVKQAWLKPNKEQLAPNIVAASKRFNLVTLWICTEILSTPGMRERVTTIEYFLRVAQDFMTLQNYCGVLQVLSAMNQTPLERLKDTWKEVNPKSMRVFQELQTVFQPLASWKLARELLHRNQPPAIPYIGIFLTDLVMLEEGIPDLERDMINIEKYRKIAATIQDIQTFQNVPYWIESLPFCKADLLNLTALSERELYERSYAIVPRQGGPAKGGPLPSDMKQSAKKAAEEAAAVANDISQRLSQMNASMGVAVSSVLDARFGRAAVAPWSGIDKTRYVYSWTDDIKIDTIESDGTIYVIHSRLQATKAEISALQRLVQFYKTQTGINDVKGLMISLVATPEDIKMAMAINTIDLVLADAITGMPITNAGSGDSSETHSGGESPMNPSPNPLPTSPLAAPVSADWSLASNSITPGGARMYRTWKSFLEAAEVPDEAIAKYVQTLEQNAIEMDQVGELNTEILRGMGFKMGHILKILRVVAAVTGVTPK